MSCMFCLLKRILQKLSLFPSDSYFEERKKRRDYEYLIAHGVETEYGYVTLQGLPIISKAPDSHIIIGKGVTLVSDSNYNIAGINHPCILSTTRKGAIINIGEGSGLSGATISCAKKVILEKRAGIGANVCVYDHDFHGIEPYNRCVPESVKAEPIIIGDGAWIGANSIILKGINIGRASVIGAGSVVTSDIPELCISAGNPAKYIKNIQIDEEKYKDWLS